MSRHRWIGIALATLAAAAALSLIRPHSARGATPESGGAASGHRLAEAWCKACHAIEPRTAGTPTVAPDFAAVANQPSTTELALKVFLRTSHPNMPNLVLTPEQTDNIVTYILSLKRN
jgi:mono/diheme cytochrome c family protein